MSINSALKKANETLEQLPEGILAYFDAIGKMGSAASQEFVDGVCRYAAWVINFNVERIRQGLLKSINQQNKAVQIVIGGINLGKRVITDPLGTIASMFDFITSPFTAAAGAITTFIQEMAKLAANVSRIASVLPPSPPNPHINYNEFKLKLGNFSMGALGSADSLPDPEVIFPKPPNPIFSKEAFQRSYEEGKKAADTEEVKQFKEKMSNIYSYKKEAIEGETA